MDNSILDKQSQHWEKNFLSKPEMFGLEPSKSAVKALEVFKKENITKIIELGAGLGRDTIFFAKNSIKVEAFDYSISAVDIIKKKVEENNLSEFVSTKIFDIRKKLPFKNNLIQGCYSHMLYCMALTNLDIKNLNNEICRILKPNGINIYTVRHTNDADYKNGINRGKDLYENDGFIVNFFSKKKIINLLKGFKNETIENFEEGAFPRKLFYVQNKKLG